jgi:hypothetical protein
VIKVKSQKSTQIQEKWFVDLPQTNQWKQWFRTNDCIFAVRFGFGSLYKSLSWVWVQTLGERWEKIGWKEKKNGRKWVQNAGFSFYTLTCLDELVSCSDTHQKLNFLSKLLDTHLPCSDTTCRDKLLSYPFGHTSLKLILSQFLSVLSHSLLNY